jgi:hypothetical protein
MADPIALIGSLTEPITKLIETTSNGIGTLYEPTRIRKKAEAEAHVATVQAHSEVRVARIRAEGERELAELADRANERLAAKELRRQGNIESIVAKAAHQLPDSVSKQPVDADWAVQFFNYAQDIGNEEVQFIWAGILAGEVNRPGAYSLRTLHTLRMLGANDARLFRRLCSYFWRTGENDGGYLGGTEAGEYLKSKGLDSYTLLRLEFLGLIIVIGGLELVLHPQHPEEVWYMGRHLVVKAEAHEKYFSLSPFTDVGLELVNLVEAEPDWTYYDVVVDAWRKAGIVVELQEDAK